MMMALATTTTHENNHTNTNSNNNHNNNRGLFYSTLHDAASSGQSSAQPPLGGMSLVGSKAPLLRRGPPWDRCPLYGGPAPQIHFDKYKEMMKCSKAASSQNSSSSHCSYYNHYSPPLAGSNNSATAAAALRLGDELEGLFFLKKFPSSPESHSRRPTPSNDLIPTPSFPRKQSSSSVASSPQSLESRSRNPSDIQPLDKPQIQSSSFLLDYANQHISSHGYESLDPQDQQQGSSSSFGVFPGFPRDLANTTTPNAPIGGEYHLSGGGGSEFTTSSSSSSSHHAAPSMERSSESVPARSSSRSSPSLDFLNATTFAAINRSSDSDLLRFPVNGSDSSLRHHSAPSSVRVPPFNRSDSSLEHPPEFIQHYPNTNDSAISGPVVSPHDGCPYPNGSLYGVSNGASLPTYPALNHSYAASPQSSGQANAGAAANTFIKEELLTDLNTTSTTTTTSTISHTEQNNNNNSELKRSLESQGFRNASSSFIKSEKDPYSSSSSSCSSSSSMNALSAASSSFNVSSFNRSRFSKDEQRARKVGVPFSVQEIVSLPMDEYNDMIARHALSDEQLSLCRDIRRRGKNKVAAQNCRKRKISQITELKTTIELNREIQNRLIEQRSHLIRMRQEYTELVLDAERQYWSKSKYDPELFEFRFSDDSSSVAVVPKISTSAGEDVSDSTNYRH